MTTTHTAITLNDVDIKGEHVCLNSMSFNTAGTACFALLGLQRSGKTTVVKTLAGLIRPAAGTGHILDYSLGDPQIMRDPRIGFLHQATHWPANLTVDDIINLAILHNPASPVIADVDRLVDLAGLAQRRGVYGSHLTPEERQRVGLIALHLRNPQLLILDDPADSADPEERRLALELIARIGVGRRVFFTTSRLTDVQQIADRVAVLHDGMIMVQDSTATLFTLPDTAVFRVMLDGDTQIVYEQLNNLVWVRHLVERSHNNQTEWTLWLDDTGNTPSSLLRAILTDRRLKIMEFTRIRPRLDRFLDELQQASVLL